MFLTPTVDKSVAGQAKLKGEVKMRGNVIPCQLREAGEDRFELVFTPYDAGTYTVTVTFGGLPLPGECGFLVQYRAGKLQQNRHSQKLSGGAE